MRTCKSLIKIIGLYTVTWLRFQSDSTVITLTNPDSKGTEFYSLALDVASLTI